jgi:hypothetical protein
MGNNNQYIQNNKIRILKKWLLDLVIIFK